MLKKVISDESGRALALTLVMLGIGVLLLPVFLAHASTNLRAIPAIEEGLEEQYAADAGVEYALYRLINNDCPEEPFDLPTLVNDTPVTVTVENEGVYYEITSTAEDTVIRSIIEYVPGGNVDIYEGALVSETDITLHGGCNVDGDICYGNGYEFVYKEPFSQTNGVVAQKDIVFPDSYEFAEMYKNEAMAGGTYTGTMEIDSDCSLGPLYITGDLEVKKDCVVTLEGIIYVEGAIKAAKHGDFTGEEGSIVAVGDIDLLKVANFGTNTDAVIMSVTGDIKIWKESSLEALMYAPDGQIYFDKACSVTGGVLANEIYAKKLNFFGYDPAFYDGFQLPDYVESRFRVRTYHINP